MSEYAYRIEYDLAPMVDRIAAQIQHKLDQAALDKIADELEQFGYVKVVRCRDCVYYCEERRNTAFGWTNEPICLSDQWSTSGLMPCHEVKPDGFCAWSERKEGGDD